MPLRISRSTHANLRVWRRICTKFLALLFFVECCAPTARPMDLKLETIAAFDEYARTTEAQRDGEIQDGRFLVIDRLPQARRLRVQEQVHGGALYLEQLRTLEGGHVISVPGGLIHHWVGLAFIPGVTLAETLVVLRDYDRYQDIYKPDIRYSRLLQRKGDEFAVHLQFYKESLVTVALNTDFQVNYTQFGDARSQSVSRSTRIAEVEHPGKPDEHEYPVGKDDGYLWRLNSYWRIEEIGGGVYVQIELIALSRTVPPIIMWLVSPLLKSIPRSSISLLLQATHDAVLKDRLPR
jgi:hypothetical protein